MEKSTRYFVRFNCRPRRTRDWTLTMLETYPYLHLRGLLAKEHASGKLLLLDGCRCASGKEYEGIFAFVELPAALAETLLVLGSL